MICPEAEVKLYVTASDEVRASRRHAELAEKSAGLTLGVVLADLRARDTRDSERKVAPLRPAEDAVHLDTSAMSVDEAVAKAIAVIAVRLPGAT